MAKQVKLYGVFSGTKWAMSYSKRRAIAKAREVSGEVRSVIDDRAAGVWDQPTFYVCSEPVADFRPAAPAGDIHPIGPAACPPACPPPAPAWVAPARPEVLAHAFCEVLAEWLTPEQLDEARRLNAAEPEGSPVCHSHDHCDANQAMIDAWGRVAGLAPGEEPNFDGDSEPQCSWINRAWAIAKAAGFRASLVNY